MSNDHLWKDYIIQAASEPAEAQLEAILRPQGCLSGLQQITALLSTVVSRFESLTGGLWHTEDLETLCQAIPQKSDCFDKIKDRAPCTNPTKIVIKEHPEHAALLVLSRVEILSKTLEQWVAITILCTIVARRQLALGQVKNRSGTLSQIDKAWRALRRLPGDFEIEGDRPSPELKGAYYQLESVLSETDGKRGRLSEEKSHYLEYLETFWAHSLGIRVSNRNGLDTDSTDFNADEDFISVQKHELITFSHAHRYTKEEVDEHIENANSVEELDDGPIYLRGVASYHPENGQSAPGRAIRQRAQSQHMQKAFQMLPGGSTELTEYDVRVLADYFATLKKPTEADLVLWLTWVSGRDLKDVATSVVINGVLDDANNDLALRVCAEGGRIDVPIKVPADRRQRRPEWSPVLRNTENRLKIPIPQKLWRATERLCLKASRQGDLPRRLFNRGYGGLLQDSTAILSKLNKTYGAQLTLRRVEKHLFYAVASQTGDMIEACCVTGRDLPRGQSAGVYYHSQSEASIQCTFESIFKQWTENAPWGVKSGADDFEMSANTYVGSDLVLNNNELKQFFADLYQKVLSALEVVGRQGGLAAFHNALTNYLLMTLFFATGYRAVASPIARDSDLNFDSGFLVIADKTDATQSQSRLVPICNQMVVQLYIYRAHCEWLSKQLNQIGGFRWPKPSERPVLFYLNEETLEAEEVRPKTMVEKLSRDYRLPLNLNRHWLRGSLRPQVAGEYIDAFMGHWTVGAEPFGRYSAMDPIHYRSVVGDAIQTLLHRLEVKIAPAIPAVMNGLTTGIRSKTPLGALRIPAHMGKGSGGELGDKERSRLRELKTKRMTERVENILSQLWEGYSQNKKSLVLTSNIVEQVHREITLSFQHVERIRAERCLHKILQSGAKKFDWRLPPLAAPASMLNRELPVTTTDNFEKLAVLHEIDYRFWNSLEEPPKFDAKKDQQIYEAGQLFYSVIAHSFCLSPMWWSRIPDAIKEGVCREGEIIWLDLDDTDDKTRELRRQGLTDKTGELRRRFFPAPITQLLLLRWYRRWGKIWPALDYQASLRIYLKRLGVKGVWAKADRMLAGMVRVHAATVLPGTLRAYAENGNLSPSIDTENFRRLFRQKRFRPAHRGSTALNVPIVEVERELWGSGTINDDMEMVKQLKACIYTEQRNVQRRSVDELRKQAINRVRKFLENRHLSAIIQLIGFWSEYMLSHKSITGRLLPPKTVRNYITSVDRYLIGCAPLEVREPDALSTEQWNAIYKECLECHIGNTSKMAGRLADFHRFLEKAFGVAPARITDEGGTSNVQARILTPKEYSVVLGWIENAEFSDDLKLLQRFALICGYRLGMRRNEVYGLEYRDLADGMEFFIAQPELMIRENDSGALKTESSVRRLPLGSLLSDDELECVRKVHLRCWNLSEGKPRTPLFIRAGALNERVSEKSIFDFLIQAMKIVSGDSGMRFHDLRHSAASYLTLKATTGDSFDESVSKWSSSGAERAIVRGFAMGWPQRARHTTKQGTWLVGKWIGHVTPGQTLSTYSHLLDWALRTRIWSYRGDDLGLGWGFRANLRTQQTLLDLEKPALEKMRQRGGLRDRKTDLSTLCNVTVKRFGSESTPSEKSFLRRPIAGCWEAYPSSIPRALVTSHATFAESIHLWAPYNLAHAAEIAAIRNNGIVCEAQIRRAAIKVGVAEETAKRWYGLGLAFRRLKQPSRKSEGPGSETRKRNGSNDPNSNRPLHDKALDNNFPQLEAFVAPYRSGNLHPIANAWFGRLMKKYAEDPAALVYAVTVYLNGSRSSHTRQVFREEYEKVEFLKLLRWLGLLQHTKVDLRLRKDACEKTKVAFWSDRLGLPKSFFRYEKKNERNNIQDLEFVITPEVPLSYMWRGYEGAEQNPFWSVLRFVVFSVAVICVEPNLDDHGNYYIKLEKPDL